MVLSDQKTIEVFEIKASQKATSVRRAAQQLADTRAILGMLFRRVNTRTPESNSITITWSCGSS